MPASASWYALRVRSRAEQTTVRALEAKLIECYLPLQGNGNTTSGRNNTTLQPLFPGYVFCRFERDYRLPVLTTPGVSYILSNLHGPEAVPDHEIEALMQLEQTMLARGSAQRYAAGEPVIVVKGALKGARGIWVREARPTRLLIGIEVLQRAVAVEIDESCVRPLREAPPQRRVA